MQHYNLPLEHNIISCQEYQYNSIPNVSSRLRDDIYSRPIKGAQKKGNSDKKPRYTHEGLSAHKGTKTTSCCRGSYKLKE